MKQNNFFIKQWFCFFIISLLGITVLSAGEHKTILMLVTGADKMENGKTTGLWLEEFAIPYEAFLQANYKVEVVTPKGGVAPIDPRSNPEPAQAAAWKDAAQRLTKTKSISGVTADGFAAVFIPGGHGVMFDMVENPAVAKLIQEFDTQGKPIAAVCHGPAALVNVTRKDGTPLVKGRKVAAFSDSEERAVELDKDMPFLLESKLRELGAKMEPSDDFTAHAVRDQNLITGQNPASSKAVAKLLIETLKDK